MVIKDNKKLVSFYVDPDDWKQLQNKINCSKSEFLRQCVEKQVNKSDKITELRKKLVNLENEKQIIELEMQDITEQIKNLENIQIQNEKDEILIQKKMHTIKNVASNDGGITIERITTIANDEIKPYILINKAKSEGIKIVDKDKQTNAKTIDMENPHDKVKSKDEQLYTAINLFNRHFHKEKGKYGNDKSKYLEKNKQRYLNMLTNYPDVTYQDFKNHVLKN